MTSPTLEAKNPLSRFQRFVYWYFSETTNEAQARAYLGFMTVAYLATFVGTLYDPGLSILFCWATAFVDVYLHIRGKVRTRLPLSIPLGLVGILGLAVRSLFIG